MQLGTKKGVTPHAAAKPARRQGREKGNTLSKKKCLRWSVFFAWPGREFLRQQQTRLIGPFLSVGPDGRKGHVTEHLLRMPCWRLFHGFFRPLRRLHALCACPSPELPFCGYTLFSLFLFFFLLSSLLRLGLGLFGGGRDEVSALPFSLVFCRSFLVATENTQHNKE